MNSKTFKYHKHLRNILISTCLTETHFTRSFLTLLVDVSLCRIALMLNVVLRLACLRIMCLLKTLAFSYLNACIQISSKVNWDQFAPGVRRLLERIDTQLAMLCSCPDTSKLRSKDETKKLDEILLEIFF